MTTFRRRSVGADGDARFERDVAVLGQAGELAHVRRIRSFAVVDRLDGGLGDRHFAEAGLGDVVDFQPKAEIA
jgi:hypothetical protein